MKSTELASMLRPFWQRDVSQIALYTVREASAELAAHSALPDIHHAQTHVLANTTGLGSDHTVAGLTAGQYLRASGATAAAFASIQDGDLPSTIVRTSRTLTAGDGLSGLGDLSADRIINIELSATSGLELVGTSPAKTLQIADTVAGNGLTIASKVLAVGVATTIQAGAGAGLSVEANAVRLTAGYDPGAASSILASDAAGKLTLPLMVATTSLTTPLILAGAGQSLTLQPPIDLILDPASNRTKMAAGVSIEASSYASQTTGWRVTDAGEADFRYLYVDEMHAKSFIADLEQALAGGQIIAKSVAVLHSNFTAPAAGATAQLVVRDLPSATGMAVFVNGDYIRIRTFSRSGGSLTIGDCWGTVALDTSYGTSGFDSTTKTQRYTFTRSSAADAGAMATGTVVYADAIILDYGTAGNGIYEVNAIDGLYALNSPYAQIATWTTHPRNMAVKSRLGNLRGIFSVDNEYGLYAGSGTAVTDRYIRASNTALELRNVPLALYDGTNNTMLLSAGASNNSPFMALGSTLPTEPLVNDGIWLGKDDTAYKFRVGAVSGGALVKGIYWDGADLIWKATNTSLDASGNLVAGPVTLSSAGVTSAATNDYANNAAYKFTSGGVVTSGTFAYATPTDTAISLSTNLWGGSSLIQDANRNAYTSVGAYAISTKDATTTFEAEARDAYGATVKLARIIANANGAQSSLAISADTVQLSGSITGHLLTTTAGTYDIGTSGTPWRKIYVGEVVATTITGSTALAGNTWQRADAGDMYIKSYTDATSRTLYISNPGTGSMHLDVEGNITLTGTVDGVDISAHAADTNAHHARSHAITSTSDHTATGLTTGHVLRASGAATFAWAQLAHGDLGSIGANDHHAQSHVLATNVALGADHTISGATPGHVLRASGATTALFAAIADADLPSTIVRTSRNMTAGAGLTGTSTLASDVTFAVGAGLGITVNADDVALTTPGSLTATSTNSSTGNHTHSIDSTIARSAITLTAGAGLTGGGDLTADRTFTLGTPSALSASTTDAVTTNSHTHSISTAAATTLTVATTNAAGSSASLARADHTHAITSSSNPGAAASILASSAAGALTLVDMTVTALTASRLVASDGSDKLVSVSALSSWIAGTSNRVTVADDGDGTITLSAPQDIHTSATPTFGGLIAPWLRPAADSTTALQLRNASGTSIFNVDTTNSRIGVNKTNPTYTFDITGTGRFTSTLYADDDLTVFDTLTVGGTTTLSGDLNVGTVLKVNKLGTRVGINRDADSQFDLDVAGPIRGTYLVGKHAIQLDNAVGVFHFDGPQPFNLDFTGSTASHMGVNGTVTGGVIHRPGKFGKAVQVAEGTTNLCTNPSFETGVADWWYNGITCESVTTEAMYGARSMHLYDATGGGNKYAGYSWTLTAGTTYTISFYIKSRLNSGVPYAVMVGPNGGYAHWNITHSSTWTRYTGTFTADVTGTYYILYAYDLCGGGHIYIDAVQLEQKAYATPYCLDPDSLVCTRDGIKKLGDVQVGEELYGKSGYNRVDAKWDVETDAFEITLRNGAKVIASGDHRFMATKWPWDYNDKSGWKYRPVSELIVGDYLQLNTEASATEQATEPDVAYLMGYLLGDGYLCKENSRGQAESSWCFGRDFKHLGDLVRERYVRCMPKSKYNEYPSVLASSDNEWVLRTNNRDVAQVFIDRGFPHGTGANGKYMPEAAWLYERGDLLEFLAGYIDSDGTVDSNGNLAVASSSKQLIAEMQSLVAMRLGVNGHITHDTSHSGYGEKDNYILRFKIVDAIRLREMGLRLLHTEKSRRLNALALGTGKFTEKHRRFEKIVSIVPLGVRKLIDITLAPNHDFIANGIVTHNCDGSLGNGHTWSGTAHASASVRNSGYLSYPTPMTGNVGTVFFWFKRSRPAAHRTTSGDTYESFFECNYGAGGPLATITTTPTVQVLNTYGLSSNTGEFTGIAAERWYFYSVTWDGTTVTHALGDDAGTFSTVSGTQVGGVTFGTDAFLVGSWGGSYHFNGLIDDLAILDYAAEADLIRTIYESDAPVFVASSVFHWRSPARVPIWVDEFGLWAQGVSGNAMLGLYGGDPRNPTGNVSKSWGGVTMYENDLVIGRTTSGGAAIHWDDSESKLRIGVQTGNHIELTATSFKIKYNTTEKISLDSSGNASISGVLNLGASGGIYQGSGTFLSPTTGLKIWNESSVGRIAGYNAGTAQWYAGTDGKLYAGGGNVSLSATGISVVASTSAFDVSKAYTFTQSGAQIGGMFLVRASETTALYIKSNSVVDDTSNTYAESNRNGGVYLSGIGHGTGKAGLVSLTAQMNPARDYPARLSLYTPYAGEIYAMLEADRIYMAGEAVMSGGTMIPEFADTPPSPADGTEVRMYMRNNNLIFQFNDGGTVRYKYMPLNGTGSQFYHTTTAP